MEIFTPKIKTNVLLVRLALLHEVKFIKIIIEHNKDGKNQFYYFLLNHWISILP